MDAIAAKPVPDFAEIDRRRAELGLSQAKLCRLAGLNAVTYTRLKSGEHDARRDTLVALADVLQRVAGERARAEAARGEAAS